MQGISSAKRIRRRVRHAGTAAAVLVTLMGAALLPSAQPALAGNRAPARDGGRVKADPSVLQAAAADPHGTLDLIVRKADRSSHGAEQLVRRLGGRVTRDLSIIDAFSARLPASALPALLRSPSVARLWGDARIHMSSTDLGIYDTYNPYTTWRQSIALDQVNSKYTGTGIGVALIDTGVTNYSDLGTRMTYRVDFTPDQSGYDHYGHGTHMSGIIAGNGTLSSGTYKGVATKAYLIDIKVAGWNGATDVSVIIGALQWVRDNRSTYKLKVLNLSFGTDSTQGYSLDPLDYAVEKVWAAGVLVVVSAGNDGPGTGTINKPADDPYVVTVGAVDTANTVTHSDDVVPDFSSRGPTQDGFSKPDLVAPGVSIVGLRARSSWLDSQHAALAMNDYYTKGSGTSQAAAVISGVAAMMFQANTAITPNIVKAALVGTASKDLASMNGAGAGMVNALAAVNAAVAGTYKYAPANQGLTYSTGTGSLDASRGTLRAYTDLNNDGIADLMTGEVDALNNAWTLTNFTNSWSSSPWYKYAGKVSGWSTMTAASLSWDGMGCDQASWAATKWTNSWDPAAWGSSPCSGWAAKSWGGT
jgi:serine protease AprX